MAENDNTKVGVGAAGKIYIAASGATLPTTATAELDEEVFTNFGFVSDAGVKIAETKSQQALTAWGGGVVRTLNTSYAETVAFTPIEVNEAVLKATYGDDQVTVSGNGAVIAAQHKNVTLPEKVVVIDTLESDTIKRRFVVPKAQLTNRGDASLTGTGFSGRELTFTGNQDSNGVTMYEYTATVE